MRNNIEYRLKITELAEKLESGWSTAAIMKECMPKWGVTSRTIERYIALAKDIVGSHLKKREQVIEAVRADIIAHEAETWMKSTLELEARLCAIISGKTRFYKILKKGEDTQEVKCRPTCKEVIHAMDLLLKLRGAYKVTVGQQTAEPQVIAFATDSKEEKEAVEKILQQAANMGKEKKKAAGTDTQPTHSDT